MTTPSTSTFKRGNPQIFLGFLLTIWALSIAFQVSIVIAGLLGCGGSGLGLLMFIAYPISVCLGLLTSLQALVFGHRIDSLPRRVGVSTVFIMMAIDYLSFGEMGLVARFLQRCCD